MHEFALSPAMLHILLAIGAGEKHGYAIMKELEAAGIQMGPGTLYGALKRMVDSAWVVETTPGPDTERRRYYRSTAVGKRAAAEEVRRMQDLLKLARRNNLRPARG